MCFEEIILKGINNRMVLLFLGCMPWEVGAAKVDPLVAKLVFAVVKR